MIKDKLQWGKPRKKGGKNNNSTPHKQDKAPHESGASDPRFEVSRELQDILAKQGYTTPTRIQQISQRALLNGEDLIGIAQTGTGKTGAFLIPMIERYRNTKADDQILVILPTRELAIQVNEEFKTLSKGLNMRSACFVGGTNIVKDIKILRSLLHIVIATPGRLIDLSNRGEVELERFEVLILDEFDRLLDMGFKKDIQRIVAKMESRKQTALFSATEDNSQAAVIKSIVKNAKKVEAQPAGTARAQIEQKFIKVENPSDKFKTLLQILQDDDMTRVLVFAETKRGVSKLNRRLNSKGLNAVQIHGDRSQGQRINALKAFESGSARIMVATDVAARGLHIDDISHVINYQEPKNPDSYIHRIGRTGRAGKVGVAYTFK